MSSTSTKQTSRNRKRRLNKKINKKANKAVLKAERKISPPSLSYIPRLSMCAQHYARALTNPFGRFSELPCIPDTNIIPTSKFNFKVRGTFQTGTAGVGWVVFDPFTALFSNSGIADAIVDDPVLYTTSSFNGDSYDWTASGGLITTGGVKTAESNSPYARAPGSTTQWVARVVAAGLKVMYMGSNFKNQGTVYLYQSPGNDNIPKGSVGSDLLNSNYTQVLPVSRKPEYVFYQPKRPHDNEFQETTEFFPSDTGNQQFILMIYIEGGDDTTPQSWSFEATAFYEVQGKGLTLTPSHSDSAGFGAVLSSLPNVNPTSAPESVTSMILKKAGDYILNYGSQVITQVGSRAVNHMLGSNSLPMLPMITYPKDL